MKLTGKPLTAEAIVFTDNTAIYDKELYVADNFLLLPANTDEAEEVVDIIPIANVKEIKGTRIKKSTRQQAPIYHYRDMTTW